MPIPFARGATALPAAFAVLLLLAIAPHRAAGDDWPTFRGDTARRGVSDATIDGATLEPAWVHRPSASPRAAWPGPAKWDAYATLAGMKSMRNYDPVFHVTGAGDRLYYGSSAEDTIVCLDAATGTVVWTFITGGPVRIAPTIAGGRVYAGSDDGHVYCLDASTGTELWRLNPSEGLAGSSRRILNNGRLISPYPVRTGVMVDAGVAYFGASLLPWEDSVLVAADAATGSTSGAGRYIRNLGRDQTLEAAMLVAGDRLVAPRGRVSPMLFDRATGEPMGALPGGGGSFVIVTDENRVVHGPGNKAPKLFDAEAGTRKSVASFEGGHALVVRDGVAYTLSDDKLAAVDRATQEVRWMVESDHPFELVMAGDGSSGVLLAGGVDEVGVYAARDGELLARLPVDGRVYGLAVAGGLVIASTEEGAIHAFRPGGSGAFAPTPEATVAEADAALAPADRTIPQAIDDTLLHRWVFQRDTASTAGGPPAFVNLGIDGPDPAAVAADVPELVRASRREVVGLNGTFPGFRVADDFRLIELPTRAITVEAWVRVDVPLQWGGIACVIQDNGAYEHGWILGYNGDRFSFGLNGADDDRNAITYLQADRPFTKGAWHHVAGTYDGEVQRVYLDGVMVAESRVQRGDLSYPADAVVHLGAYKDKDEDFRITGGLREVRILARALEPAEIAANAAQERGLLPEPEAPAAPVERATPRTGPIIHFTAPGEAEVLWETDVPSRTRVSLHYTGPGAGTAEPASRTVTVDGLRRDHRVLLTGLRRMTPYHVTIAIDRADGRTLETEPYLVDSSFNYTEPTVAAARPAVVDRRVAGVAELAAAETSGRPALVVLDGMGDGSLARELVARTPAQVVVLERGAARVEAMRRSLLAEGIHGHRVSVVDLDDVSLGDLPRASADVVVSMGSGGAGLSEPELLHLAAPGGGLVITPGPRTVRRPALDGAAPWRHMYAEPNNAAFAGETLAGAGAIDELEVQWVGRPGPRYQSDRGNRKPAPLAAGGRVFMQGLNRIIAVDAFNGLIHWSIELPELQRFNIPRDAGNWCTDGDWVYLAMGSRCYRADARTGDIAPLAATDPDELTSQGGSASTDEWGYLAVTDASQTGVPLLLGSSVRRGAEYTAWWGGAMWYDGKDDATTSKVCSDELFAEDLPGPGATRSSRRWTYAGGLIVNPTITAHGRSIWFLECRDPELKGGATRRLNGAAFWASMHLVCLDALTGEVRWERPLEAIPGTIACYLAATPDDGGRDRLIYTVSTAEGGNRFGVYAIDGATGDGIWTREIAWEKDHHGGHLSRPAIVGNKVYVRPHVLDLTSGEVVHTGWPGGHQCGTYTCSTNALFMRIGNLGMWDQTTGRATRFNRVRPDCWISTIPAMGMLLSPEGGGGCSCGSWMETSMGLIPRAAARLAATP